MAPNLTIDLFSDVVCPWCFIGSTRLEQALAGMANEVQAEVCYHPFFLDPALPKAGVYLPDKLSRKLGVSPTQLKQLWGRVESAAAISGLTLDLSLQTMMYRTEGAHTLLRHSHAKGTQPALAKALFQAYFQQALNIGDEAVLADVAEPHGFTRAEALELVTSETELELTREEAASAAQGGITGVPFFVFDGRLAVSGAQSVEVLQAAMRQALEQATPSEAPPSP